MVDGRGEEMKLSIEITPEMATKRLELNGKVFSETWVLSPDGYSTTGLGINSQVESEYGEDCYDTFPGLGDFMDAIDEIDVTNVITAFSGIEEAHNAE